MKEKDCLQANRALVVAFRAAPKTAAGNLIKGERRKLMSMFNKTEQQFRHVVMLVRRADKEGISLSLLNNASALLAPSSLAVSPSGLTVEIEVAMKKIMKTMNNKVSGRKMKTALHGKGINLSLATVHQYIRAICA